MISNIIKDLEYSINLCNVTHTEMVHIHVAHAKEILKLLQNPDLALIIRCRDCFYWEPETVEEGDSYGHCRNQYAPCENQQTDMNWFCGSGERIKEQ